MLYELFTDGQVVAARLLIPALLLTGVLGMIWFVRQGVGVRRSDRDEVKRLRQPLRCLMQATFTLTLLAGGVLLLGDGAVRPGRSSLPDGLRGLVGGYPSVDGRRLLLSGLLLLALLILGNGLLAAQLQPGSRLREWRDAWRSPRHPRGESGSSHFCTAREYRRYRRPDADGVTLFGAFWGEPGMRLDAGQGRFCLSGEDVARGLLTLGGPGSGKSQAVILPIMVDRTTGLAGGGCEPGAQTADFGGGGRPDQGAVSSAVWRGGNGSALHRAGDTDCLRRL
jgi:hypothetical protein